VNTIATRTGAITLGTKLSDQGVKLTLDYAARPRPKMHESQTTSANEIGVELTAADAEAIHSLGRADNSRHEHLHVHVAALARSCAEVWRMKVAVDEPGSGGARITHTDAPGENLRKTGFAFLKERMCSKTLSLVLARIFVIRSHLPSRVTVGSWPHCINKADARGTAVFARLALRLGRTILRVVESNSLSSSRSMSAITSRENQRLRSPNAS
jgi:hypothetical protein